jgi:hypothetical protein
LTAAHIKEIKFWLNMASSIFGITGSWLMSRRYAQQFGRSILFACIAPFLYAFGRGDRVRRFIEAKVSGNKDIPDSASEMALGLALLFLAFLLQLGSTVVDLLG